jgi:allantoate deiminase
MLAMVVHNLSWKLMADAISRIMKRLATLGGISEEPGRLTRRFGTPAMRQAVDTVRQWMAEAGMTTRQDPIGNLLGHYPGPTPDAKVLLLGSHLDTVPDAGKFDGALGVVIAIAGVEELAGQPLPFALEVIAFADEEGARFNTSYLGSAAVAGDCRQARRPEILDAIRAMGGDPGRLEDCRLDPQKLAGYFEVHIEQGPVLEKRRQPVGVVTAIAGQTRASATFHGEAGHAGTTPMALRHDALVAASKFVLETRRYALKHKGLVATVGRLAVEPGAANVIPGRVDLSVDIRHADDAQRQAAMDYLQSRAGAWSVLGQTATVRFSPAEVQRARAAARRHVPRVIDLVSGAGHDAAMLARITPAAMLFVRCQGGLSHHPNESVEPADIGVALNVLCDYVGTFS